MFSNIKIWQKMLLISVLFTIPVWILLYFFIHRENRTIDFTLKERLGIAYLKPLRNLLVDLQEYKSSSYLYLKGKSSLKDAVLSQQSKVDGDFSDIDKLDGAFEMGPSMKNFRESWETAKTQRGQKGADANDKALAAMISQSRNLFWRVGDQSNLILDPDLDSYYMMDDLVNKVLNNVVYFRQLNDFLLGARSQKMGNWIFDEKTQLFGLIGYIKWGIDRMKINAQTCADNMPDKNLKADLNQAFTKNEDASQYLVNHFEAVLSSSTPEFVPQKIYFDWIHNASEANLNYWDANLGALDKLLLERIRDFEGRKMFALFSVLFVTGLTYLFVFRILRTIQDPILLISNRLKEFALDEGDFTKRLQLASRDEIGELASSFNAFVAKLHEDSKDQLKNNQEFYRAIIEKTLDGVAIVDDQGKTLYISPAVERILGYSVEERLGKSTFEVVASSDLPRIQALFKGLLAAPGLIKTEEISVRHKDGTLRILETTARSHHFKRPDFQGIILNYADVTESKKAQVAKNRLASILEQTDDAVALIDLEGRYLDLNRGAEKLYGYSKEELLGQFPPFLDLNEYKAMIERFKKQLEDGATSIRYEAKRQTKDGRSLEVETTVSAIRSDDRKIVGLSFMVRDITERKKADAATKRLASILEQTTDGVIVISLDGRILDWNKGAEQVYGYSKEEIIGKPAPYLTPGEHEAAVKKIFEGLARGENGARFEARRPRKDGKWVDVENTTVALRDEKGEVTGFSAIVRDITERKKAEEALKTQEEQLRRADKMNAIGRLAGGVAHDFNNLLSVIRGNADFILSNQETENPNLEEVGEIQKAVKRGAELTKQLLVFGQKEMVKPQAVNLNEVCGEMNKMFKRLLDAPIELVIQPDKQLSPILADLGQMHQVVLNLAINARDAMPEGGKLVVETRNLEAPRMAAEKRPDIPAGSYVRLNVTDTGIGMDAETQRHIFEPFFTTKGEKGNGLGLATVYGIVAKWKGHIFVQSVLGQGTTFSIYFPTMEESPEAVGQARKSAVIAGGSETILLAEDEEPVRKIMVRTLEKYGYRVLEARNGLEAAQIIQDYKEPIHLLLTDTVMPKMDGKMLADEIRKVHPKTKILFVSGYPQEILLQKGVLSTEINLIQKPFEIEELTGKIRKILDEA